MMTFLQLKQKIRPIIWPSGEAARLRVPHDQFFIRAMIDLQTWVPCLQQFNTSEFKFCSTYWENAKTVVEQPNGIIRRVYTLANTEWRDRVYYDSTNFDEIEFWAHKLYLAATPANVGLPKLPMGFRQAEAAVDSICGRARVGAWAINRNRLYIAPWLQSNEMLVVEWDGLKTRWEDTDSISEDLWTPDIEEAIGMYVKWRHAVYYGTDQMEKQSLKQEYDGSLADIIWYCREQTRQQERVDFGTPRFPTGVELNDDVIPAVAAPLWDAFLGDWGNGADPQPLIDVVALIESKNPRNVFPLGDNIYGASPGVPSVDSVFGKNWSKRIFPYTGIYPHGTKHSFWPALGNHDWDYGAALETDFLPALKNNRRYYSIVSGSVHYFIISTDPREPDGGYVDANTSTENSIMGQWLKLSMALSTAKWKVVIGHHTPYSSDVLHGPGEAWMRWPFKAWGANMTLWAHAHNYEEFIKDGIPYINNGLGGKDIRGFNGVQPGSNFQYNANFGAGFIKASCEALTHYFFSRNGTLIRTVIVDVNGTLTFLTGDVVDGGSGSDNGGDTGGNMSEREIYQEAAAEAFQMLFPVPDDDGVVLSSPVLWSDLSSGTYTLLVKNASFAGTDSWKVTYDRTGKTLTRPTVTRDANGNIIARPALVIS